MYIYRELSDVTLREMLRISATLQGKTFKDDKIGGMAPMR